VRIGKPISFDRNENYEDVTATLHQIVERL
jgi:hypothetical protein